MMILVEQTDAAASPWAIEKAARAASPGGGGGGGGGGGRSRPHRQDEEDVYSRLSSPLRSSSRTRGNKAQPTGSGTPGRPRVGSSGHCSRSATRARSPLKKEQAATVAHMMSPSVKTPRKVRTLESQKKHRRDLKKLDKTKKINRKTVESVALRLHSSELAKVQRLEDMRDQKLMDDQKVIDGLMNFRVNGKKKKRVRLDSNAMESSMERLYSAHIAAQVRYFVVKVMNVC